MFDFPYVFWRVVHFYSMSDEEVLEMPVNRFWSASKTIERIESDRDIRNLVVSRTSAHGDEDSTKTLEKKLRSSVGKVVVIEDLGGNAEADQTGLNKLANLGKIF